ncbi:hypothetical protein BC629DRAFT_1118990 [Irpex lacteus]|nr:hypothetical protein BC629DRAFT_1118990 [Irpex lacteus]
MPIMSSLFDDPFNSLWPSLSLPLPSCRQEPYGPQHSLRSMRRPFEDNPLCGARTLPCHFFAHREERRTLCSRGASKVLFGVLNAILLNEKYGMNPFPRHFKDQPRVYDAIDQRSKRYCYHGVPFVVRCTNANPTHFSQEFCFHHLSRLFAFGCLPR